MDFSETSEKALSFALNIASNTKAKLWILHSYRLIEPVPEYAGFGPFNLKEELEKMGKEKFRSIEEKYLGNVLFTYEFLLEIGFPEDTIATALDFYDIDMVIMGTQGSSGVSEILGSTTGHIIDTISCPVLVIPKNAEFKGIKKITIAYDYLKSKKRDALEIVTILSKIYKAELDIVNFNTTTKTGKEESSGILGLDEYLDGVRHKYHFKLAKNFIEGITDYIKQEGTDILVMIPHSHSLIESLFHSSMTRKMILHSDIPLLTIHD